MSETPRPGLSATTRLPTAEAWGALPGLAPEQEYRVLAQELQTCFPEATPRQLDRLIAHEMLCYGGHSSAVVIEAMLQASLYLATEPIAAAQDYVQGVVTEALQPDSGDNAALGWDS